MKRFVTLTLLVSALLWPSPSASAAKGGWGGTTAICGAPDPLTLLFSYRYNLKPNWAPKLVKLVLDSDCTTYQSLHFGPGQTPETRIDLAVAPGAQVTFDRRKLKAVGWWQ